MYSCIINIFMYFYVSLNYHYISFDNFAICCHDVKWKNVKYDFSHVISKM